MSKNPDTRLLSAADIIEPDCGSPALLTSSPTRGHASQADLVPQAPRTGSLQALECPSRTGRRLTYRDGRTIDLQGSAL